MFADRQSRDELRQRVQVEIGSEYTAEFAVCVLDRGRTGDARNPLPVEDVRWEPDESPCVSCPFVERTATRVVLAVLALFHDLTRAIRKWFVFHELRLAVHDVAAIDQ